MQSDELSPIANSGRLQILGLTGLETFYQQNCFLESPDEDNK